MNTFYIAMLFFIGVSFQMIAQYYVHKRGKHINNMVLPDFAFEYLPKYNPQNELFFDILNEALPPIMVILFLSLCMVFREYYVLFSWLLGVGILFFLRGILFSATVLPDPSQRCTMDNLLGGGCNDLIYSGHTALTLFTILHIYKYFIGSKWFIIFSIIYMSTLIFSILKNRNHYLVDIILAIVFAFLIFATLDNLKIKDLKKTSRKGKSYALRKI